MLDKAAVWPGKDFKIPYVFLLLILRQ
jgi:hypothetical protein